MDFPRRSVHAVKMSRSSCSSYLESHPLHLGKRQPPSSSTVHQTSRRNLLPIISFSLEPDFSIGPLSTALIAVVPGSMPPVKQSASKEDFLKALGLNVNVPDEKWKFSQMWEEVTQYWVKNFETSSRTILKPEYASNPGVQRPYKWAHLSPGVIDAAINQIWRNGAQWPRFYYDLGQSEDRRIYNWVLKWLLWHVCRYRDWRNRKSKSNGGASAASSSSPVTGELPPHDYWSTIMN